MVKSDSASGSAPCEADTEDTAKAQVPAVIFPNERGLGPELRAHLGTQLRAIYHEVVSEQVPDRFLRLLDDLARKGRVSDEY